MTETLDQLRARHSAERLAAAGNDDRVILTRYGRPVALTDGRRVLGAFHRLQSQSTDWAIRHDGFDVHTETLPGGFDNRPAFAALLAWWEALEQLKAGRTPVALDRWERYAVTALESAAGLILGPDLDPLAQSDIVTPVLQSIGTCLDYVDGRLSACRGELAQYAAHLADYAGVAL